MFKRIILTLTASAVLFACKKDCPYPPQDTCKIDLKKGLFAYYPFNGNFNDESGHGNNAVPMNGAFLTTDLLGRQNKAAGFDGVNDYLIVRDSGRLNSDSVTISFRVMVNTVNRRHTLISRVNFYEGSGLIYGIHQSENTSNRWNFAVPTNKNDCSTIYTYDTSIAVYSKEPTQAGRWYSFIATFSWGEQKLYIDGKLVASKKRDFTTLKKCNNTNLLIGGWQAKDIISIDGKLDEIRLYDRVLSGCEINELAETFAE